MRIPARQSAEAMVSLSFASIRRPSRSTNGMDFVSHGIAFDSEPPAAAGIMKPALGLPSRGVFGQPQAPIILFRRNPGTPGGAELAAEPEFGKGSAATVGTGKSRCHAAKTSSRSTLPQGQGRNYLSASSSPT